MVDKVKNVDKPLPKTAAAFKASISGAWDKGKGFGPIGPWFVTKDEIRDPQRSQVTMTQIASCLALA